MEPFAPCSVSKRPSRKSPIFVQQLAVLKLRRETGLMARSEPFAVFSSSRDLPKKSKPLMCMKIQFVYMKIKFSSQRREMLLFLATNTAAVTSRANQQLLYCRSRCRRRRHCLNSLLSFNGSLQG